jgi:hypothetical protein
MASTPTSISVSRERKSARDSARSSIDITESLPLTPRKDPKLKREDSATSNTSSPISKKRDEEPNGQIEDKSGGVLGSSPRKEELVTDVTNGDGKSSILFLFCNGDNTIYYPRANRLANNPL